jgi:maltose O-acetyltransferase
VTEKEKMLAGELYLSSGGELSAERAAARKACAAFNMSGDISDLAGILGSLGDDSQICPSFRCDYGYNIHIGRGVYINFNCVILDGNKVHIGDGVLIAPQAGIYTAAHPTDPRKRGDGLEFARPVTILDNVWIGGGAVICPGVTIGENSVIGAGAVVTRDIPANSVAAGNPCRVIKALG